MTDLQKALEYAHQNRERFLNELIEVLKIPSISTRRGIQCRCPARCGMDGGPPQTLGMENVEIMPTDGGHPVVYGEYLKEAWRTDCAGLWTL